MNTDDSSKRLLVIDSDEAVTHTLRQHFESLGYALEAAHTAQRGLALASTIHPHLILLAAQLPDMAVLDVFHTLRDKPRTGHIPVMVLAGQDDMVLQNAVLEAGAYDFIAKPLDLDILTLRVRNALRRAEREGLTEVRTGLPTGRLIDERLDQLADETDWYRIDLRIENFNTFRDLYGFVTANEALRFAGNLITQIVNEHGTPDDFIGHRSGEQEFVIITAPARGPRLREMLAQRVTQELHSFYNFMEREQGFVEVENSAGQPAHKPLMSAQVHITQDDAGPGAPAVHPDDVWVDTEEDDESDTPSDATFEW